MKEVKFNYNLYWALPVTCIAGGMFITICCMTASFDAKTNPGPAFVMFLMCGLTGFMAFTLLRIIFKAFRGEPAIALTKEVFIANTQNLQIDWNDITNVAIRKTRATMLGISVSNPAKYFDTPMKKFLYKLNAVLTDDDWRINLDFVSGNNQYILEQIDAFRESGASAKRL